MPHWKVTAQPTNGGKETTFEVSNTSAAAEAVQAEFERTHGKRLKFLKAELVGDTTDTSSSAVLPAPLAEQKEAAK